MFTLRARFGQRIAICLSALLSLVMLATNLVTPQEADAAPKKKSIIAPWSPPSSKSLYNTPINIGRDAHPYVYTDELIRAINATPSGETISISTYLTSFGPVIKALAAAAGRGVHIHYVTGTDDYKKNKKPIDGLKKAVRSHAGSYLKVCNKSCYSKSGTQHVKVMLISRCINKKGTSQKYVVFIASGNISTENVINSWNSAQLIVGRKKFYDGLKSYFDGMGADKTHKDFKPVSEGPYTAFLYPTTKPFNPFIAALQKVKCKAAKGYGNKRGQTVVRVVMYKWRNNTSSYAKDLVNLKADGCDVEVILSKTPTDSGIVKILRKGIVVKGHPAKGRVTVYNARAKGRFAHAKMGFISGTVGGKSVNMVVTGSLNFTRSSMVDSTDIALRMYGKKWYDQALDFYKGIVKYSHKM